MEKIKGKIFIGMRTLMFPYGNWHMRIVTMLEAFDAVENSRAPTNLVLLPPASGDLSVDSDVEETPNDLLDEDYVMEPA